MLYRDLLQPPSAGSDAKNASARVRRCNKTFKVTYSLQKSKRRYEVKIYFFQCNIIVLYCTCQIYMCIQSSYLALFIYFNFTLTLHFVYTFAFQISRFCSYAVLTMISRRITQIFSALFSRLIIVIGVPPGGGVTPPNHLHVVCIYSSVTRRRPLM